MGYQQVRQDNNNNKSRKKKISFSEMFSTKTKLVAYINPNLTQVTVSSFLSKETV